jgi:hypothetical protein
MRRPRRGVLIAFVLFVLALAWFGRDGIRRRELEKLERWRSHASSRVTLLEGVTRRPGGDRASSNVAAGASGYDVHHRRSWRFRRQPGAIVETGGAGQLENVFFQLFALRPPETSGSRGRATPRNVPAVRPASFRSGRTRGGA